MLVLIHLVIPVDLNSLNFIILSHYYFKIKLIIKVIFINIIIIVMIIIFMGLLLIIIIIAIIEQSIKLIKNL